MIPRNNELWEEHWCVVSLLDIEIIIINDLISVNFSFIFVS